MCNNKCCLPTGDRRRLCPAPESSNFHIPIPLRLKSLCAYNIFYPQLSGRTFGRLERRTFGCWLASLTSSVKQSNANSCHFLQVRHWRKAGESWGKRRKAEPGAFRKIMRTSEVAFFYSLVLFYVHSSSVCFPRFTQFVCSLPTDYALAKKKEFTQNERENTAKVKKKYDENVAFSL